MDRDGAKIGRRMYWINEDIMSYRIGHDKEEKELTDRWRRTGLEARGCMDKDEIVI